jgi:hypothetical protein
MKMIRTNLCQRLSKTQGHGAAGGLGKINQKKNVITSLKTKPVTFRLVTQCLSQLRSSLPQTNEYTNETVPLP